MKARYFARTGNSSGISAKDRKVINAEINRQILEKDAEYRDNLDAVVLYTLHVVFGYGPQRLRKFYDKLFEEHNKLVKHYEMEDEDGPFLAKEVLKRIGVDITAWNEDWEERYKKFKESENSSE